MRLKLTLLFGVVVTALLSGESVQAEGGCPPGFFPVGGGNAGWSGCAPIPVPPAIERPRPSEPTRQAPLPPDPAMMRLLDAGVKQAEFEAKYGRILFHDPKVGVWLMTSAGDGTGKNCAVSFAESPKASNIVSFFGPHQKMAGAILFQGTGVPVTPEAKEIQPALTFRGAKPVPINAALIPYGKNSAILVLADMAGMMRHANAENEVTLHLDGKEVFRASMTGFLKARSAMLECMRTN